MPRQNDAALWARGRKKMSPRKKKQMTVEEEPDSPPWYATVEVAFLVSEQTQLCLVPGSHDSTLLYTADAAAQRQLWSWWCCEAWHTESTFDR